MMVRRCGPNAAMAPTLDSRALAMLHLGKLIENA
jgi:hypothetical protein